MRNNSIQILRREFLRFGGLTLAGLASPGLCAQHSGRSADPRPAGARPPIRFENRQARSGLDFVLNNGTIPDKPIIDSVLGGVAVFDYDNDGFLDIFFTNGARIPSLEKDGPPFFNRLYRNNRDGTFTDVTERAGVHGAGYSMGVAAADYDNNGWTDLYVTGINRNFLYHNNGDGTFTDVTERAGVAGVDAKGSKLWAVGAAWLDYDNDGRLDLLVVNYLDWNWASSKVCGEEGKRLSCSPLMYGGQPNILYHNNGDGTFMDVSESSGIGEHVGKGMGLAVADYDGDGFTDIFVGNDDAGNFLFKNLGGQRFIEVAITAGVAYTEDGLPISNMGVDFRDLNDDGWPDLVISSLEGDIFQLYLNTGHGFFVPSSFQAGLGYGTLQMSGWGVGAYDLDNDGHKDVFSANSHVSENVGLYGHDRYEQSNAVFLNLGHARFCNATAEAGPAMQVAAAHRGCAFGDLNNDGWVDVVVSVIGKPAELLYNTSPGDHHWILLQAEGTKSNRDGIGTKIKLTGESGRVQYNHVTTSVGYVSSSDKRVHFGLGADRRIREIELRWPSGKVQVLKDVAADQILKIREE
jgi:enediyne biosynthesis protein E4